MTMKQMEHLLTPGTTFTKAEFANWTREINPQYSERSIYWLLNKLQIQQQIIRLGKNLFQFIGMDAVKPIYTYKSSSQMDEVSNQIKEKYPLIEFQTWEFIQLNEFVNHQIAHNILFVEVENMLEETIFEFLKEIYPCVLLCPSVDTFYQYKATDDTIVILKLISQAPKPLPDTHSACLEKILVDLFSSKITGHLIERAEYPAIYEDAFQRYCIDERKMFRYAKRRNAEQEILNFIENDTAIHLITRKTHEK